MRMKRLLVVSGAWVLLVSIVTAVAAPQKNPGLASSNGVDLIRGTWGGTLSLPDGTQRQINLYFNATAEDPEDPAYSKASGYFSHDNVGGSKRAKAPALPMLAGFVQSSEGSLGVVILATVQVPPDLGSGTVVMRLAGTAVLRGSAVTDDLMEGTWSAPGAEGSWSARHLDRRNVNAPPVDLSDPTMWFSADVYAGLEGPLEGPRVATMCLSATSNIVMDRVRVACPNGSTVELPPYTDVFSPDVDWQTAFRFSDWPPELPVTAGRYVFTALDVAGWPIPGVTASDVWGGVEPPDPPTNVSASLAANGITVQWDEVPEVPGSFDPESGIGFYQLELSDDSSGAMVYGANGITDSFHLIPLNSDDFTDMDGGLSLDELEDGLYRLRTSVVSLAPADSEGQGIEYHNADSTTQTIWIEIATVAGTRDYTIVTE